MFGVGGVKLLYASQAKKSLSHHRVYLSNKKKIVNNNQCRTCRVDDFEPDSTGEMETKRSMWEKSHY